MPRGSLLEVTGRQIMLLTYIYIPCQFLSPFLSYFLLFIIFFFDFNDCEMKMRLTTLSWK